MWPVPLQVTRVEWRPCRLGTTWWCLDLLSRPSESTFFSFDTIYSYQTFYQWNLWAQIVLFCSVHATFLACLSVLGEGSVLCGYSRGFFIFFPLWKEISFVFPHLNWKSKDRRLWQRHCDYDYCYNLKRTSFRSVFGLFILGYCRNMAARCVWKAHSKVMKTQQFIVFGKQKNI